MIFAIPQAVGDTFPPDWGVGIVDEAAGPVHFAPVAWPTEPPDPTECGTACGDWKPYSRFQAPINDPRTRDPSNGGTAPQNYVNISSSCIDKNAPSIYYYLYKHPTDQTKDVLMFRWRVEQIANNYATGPSAGNYGATDPWSSALWTVLFDVDGSGYRSLAAHLNGSSGAPANPVDLLAGVWGNIPTQSIDYTSDPNIHLIAHNPTAFTLGSKILNFHNTLSPDTTWPAGSVLNGTTYDYGTTRARVASNNACTEYFVDYQIPIRMLDASSSGPDPALTGPKITRSTPISMLFCTANSLNNPFQKDCALNRSWLADANKPAPFGDYISFDQTKPYAQPIISSVTATAPSSCPGNYSLQTKVQDTMYVDASGTVKPSIKEVEFYYWLDKDGDGTTAGDLDSAWSFAVTGTLKTGSLNTWVANWDSTTLLKGKYLIGVQAVDDRTLHDDGVADSPVDNRTFSYLTGSTATSSDAELAVQGEIYTNAWSFDGATKTWGQGVDIGWVGQGAIPGSPDQQAAFAAQPHASPMTPAATEDWFGNPAVTGVQTAMVGLAVNACGKAPTITKAVNPSSVATGQPVAYTVTIANASGSAITLTQIDDSLPSGFTYASTTSVTNAGVPVIPTASPAGGDSGTVSWILNGGAGISIANGTSVVLIFDATASGTAGTYNNTATANTSFGSITSAPVAVGVDAARISLSKTPGAYLVNPGGTVTYALAYSNDSSVQVTGATLTDTLPANVSCTSYTVNGGTPVSCSGTSVSISLGSLAAGATGTVALTVTVDAGYNTTSLVNSATLDVLAPDGVTHVTKTATSTIAVNVPAPAFSLTKTASAAQIAENTNLTWTIAYNNYGTGSASNVVISDPLPSGFNYVSSTPNADSAPSVGANGTVTWNLGTLASGASGSVQVVAKTAASFTGTDNPATNTATVSWTGGTPVTSSSDVGVTQTGSTCSSYYFRDTTGNVGFDGTKQLATKSPVPTALDTGSKTTVTAPGKDGGVYVEAVRFYQDPSSGADVTFSGTLTNNIYIDRSPGPALNFRAIVYDYDSVTGTTTQLGLADPTTNAAMSFGGSTKGLLTFSVSLSGTLQKDHRLLWVYEVQSNHNTTTFPVEFQYNGTVTNGISSGTTAAISYANYCVTPPANLVLQKTASDSTVNVTGSGRTLTYTLNYTNTSGSTAATSAVLSDALPAGTTFVSASSGPAADSTTTPSVGANGTVTWNFATIAAGASGSASVTVNVPDDLTGTAAINNTGSLSSTQTSVVTATATTSVIGGGVAGTPSLSVTKSANKTMLLAGESVTYTISVVNVGTGSASSVVVSDDFPEQAYFSYGSCTTATGSCNQVGGVLTWNVGTLAAGASATLTFTMSVAATGVPAGVTMLDNLATVADSDYCTGGSPPASCTSDTVTLSISGNPNLTLVKSATPNNALQPDDTVSYSITVTNTGSATANSVAVSDPIPSGMAYQGSITATAGSGSFDAVNNAVVYSVGDLAAGASATLGFQATVLTPPAGTTAINTSNVATASAANAPLITASASATGTATPSLTLSKTGPSTVPYPGAILTAAVTADTTVSVDSTLNIDVGKTVRINGTNLLVLSKTSNSLTLDGVVTAPSGTGVLPAVSYVLSYKNTGTGIAPSVILTDTLPAGAIFVSASDGGIDAAGTVTWTIGNVASDVSGSVTVTIIPGGTGSIINSAHITCTGCTPPADPSASTTVGGLIITKVTTTPLVVAGNTANYVITVQNTLGSAVAGASLSLTDTLPGGFAYDSTSSLTINGVVATATVNPVAGDQYPTWSNFSADIAAGQSLVLAINVIVDANQGPGVFQNAVSATAAPGVAITPFDPLLTTAEDVTVPPAGSGVINGYVFLDTGDIPGAWDESDGGYSGFKVTMENAASDPGICTTTPSDAGCYIAYTDDAGFFSTIVPAGDWIVTNASPGGIVSLTVGQTPKTLNVVAGAISSQDVGYSGATYTVTYNGNTNTGGTAPTDGSSPYVSGATVTVLGVGTLTKTGNTFAGWNTAADGSGTSYAAAATFVIAADTTLYAQWSLAPPPAAANDTATTNYNTSVIVTAYANDSAGTGATLALNSIDMDPSTVGMQNSRTIVGLGTFTANGDGTVLFVPLSGFHGVVTAPYTIQDSLGQTSNVANITVTVRNPASSSGPSAQNDFGSTLPATPVTLPVLANDVPGLGNTLTATSIILSGAIPAQGGWVANADGTVTFTPAGGFTGTATANYTVQDSGSGTSNVATITVVVGGGATPSAQNDSGATKPTTPVTLSVLANDVPGLGNTLTLTSIILSGTNPAQGVWVANADGTVTFTPAAGFTGDATANYTVQDTGPGTSNIASITITVNPVAPAAIDDVAPAGTRNLTPVGNDSASSGAVLDPSTLDLDPTTPGIQLTITTSQGTWQVTNVVTGAVNFAPAAGFYGTASLPYAISDSLGNIATATMSVPIDPSGVVYNSRTRLPISGATVTLLYNGGNANAFVVGGNATLVTNALGQYAFFLNGTGAVFNYSLTVSSAGYTSPSTAIPPQVGTWPAGGGPITAIVGPPTGADPTTYYLSGPLPTVDVINNNIPLDPIPVPVDIPTLSESMMVALAGLLLLFGFVSMRRRRM
ncbi:MAG: hypothetical protein A3H99_12650 [Gallionellales bacterium RIFCSPLOWO2_02_FULL_59_110]|nr:MAG: hypothetical protein A3H99_12650 [Gallionellales bacterium RIFCSPLOWO2_02_FULL_59_110]